MIITRNRSMILRTHILNSHIYRFESSWKFLNKAKYFNIMWWHFCMLSFCTKWFKTLRLKINRIIFSMPHIIKGLKCSTSFQNDWIEKVHCTFSLENMIFQCIYIRATSSWQNWLFEKTKTYKILKNFIWFSERISPNTMPWPSLIATLALSLCEYLYTLL